MDKTLRTYAKENGLTVTRNTAYGRLKGYTTTFSKGKDHIRILLSASFSDVSTLADFKNDLYQKSISREYRVLELVFHPTNIDITLSYRTATDINRIEAFMNYLLPLLRKHNAIRSNFCTECNNELTTERRNLIDAVHSLFSRRERRYQSN